MLTSIVCLVFIQIINSAYHRQSNPYKRDNANTLNMRAWTCHGRTQKEMVDKLAAANIVTSNAVQQCMMKVDRVNYVLNKQIAYDDTPQSIGYGQTISAPHMHAHVLEELIPPLLKIQSKNPETHLKILDVGCGSGYLTSCFGRLVEKGNPLDLKGNVYGIEYVQELVNMSKANINKAESDLLQSGTVTVMPGNGWKGLSAAAPFHAIHVGAAADSFPSALMSQLTVGGRMVIPVGPDGGYQNLYRVDRVAKSPTFQESDYVIKQLLGVRYVPLVHGN